MTRQVPFFAKEKVQHRGKPNIKTWLLHNVKGDSQSQLATTFISCKRVTRQIWCCASNKKEVQHSEKTKIFHHHFYIM
jgi:hypothetical protein